ncbi:MAG: hypothetical protein WDZ36_00345 [Balneolaceae bacterium]
MTDQPGKSFLYSPVLILMAMFVFTACDLTSQQQQQSTPPQAILSVEFLEEGTGEEGTGEALANKEVRVFTIFNDDGEEQDNGPIKTNDKGLFEVLITNNTQVVVTHIIFELEHNGVNHRFEEEIDLQLRTQGELDRESLSILVPSGNPSEDDGEEENGDGEG